MPPEDSGIAHRPLPGTPNEVADQKDEVADPQHEERDPGSGQATGKEE